MKPAVTLATTAATPEEQKAFTKQLGLQHLPVSIDDSDMANAGRLARRHGKCIRFAPDRGWHFYDGRRWIPDEKTLHLQALAKETARSIYDEIKCATDQKAMFVHAKRSQSKNAIEAMIFLARSEPGIPANLTEFDADAMLLNVANGTIDLRTRELRPHCREDLLTKLAPVQYDRNADFELWDAFVRKITGGSDELYAYLQRMVGYLLTGMTTEQALHFLYGLGANGKTVFSEILASVLGDYAIIASPEMVMARRHSGIPNDVARLRGVRVALMNETAQGARFDEAKLKDLTGSDSLTGRFLHAEFFDFTPTHKLIIRGNHKPSIGGTDDGIWRRLQLVPFTVQIPIKEQDRRLLEKLRGELPGILRWAVDGCQDWQRDGLNPPVVITNAVKQYRDESDTLGRFIDEQCKELATSNVRSSDFFEAYQQFSERASERWIPSKDLPIEMQRRGFSWKRTKVGGMYFGLELKSRSDPDWEKVTAGDTTPGTSP